MWIVVDLGADGELFVGWNECAFPIWRPCYEVERKYGNQCCTQYKTRYKWNKDLVMNMSGKMEINLAHNARLDTSGIKVGRSFYLLIWGRTRFPFTVFLYQRWCQMSFSHSISVIIGQIGTLICLLLLHFQYEFDISLLFTMQK